MSEPDKRLNALVHEALGAVWCQEPLGPDGRAVNAGEPYMVNSCAYNFAGRTRVPRPENFSELYDGPEYDTDWDATGPLIERLKIALLTYHESDVTGGEDSGCHGAILYLATLHDGEMARKHIGDAVSPSPLVAVCNLLIALAAAGKLEAA